MPRGLTINAETKCAICGHVAETVKGLSSHIATMKDQNHDLSLEQYFLKYVGELKKCPCGNKTRFLNLRSGFRKFCGKSCPRQRGNRSPQKWADKRPKMLKKCEHCEQEYLPDNGNQRWCLQCAPDERARYRIVRYGLPQSEYDLLIERQNGTCALCPKEPTDVDHDHQTKEIRGILCAGCNTALNRFDQPGWAERAKHYILNPPKLKARYRR